MTALTVETDRAITGGQFRRLPSASGVKPYVGSLLSFGSGGYAHPLVAGEMFAGIARDTIQDKDKAGSDGARSIEAVGGMFLATLTVSSVTVADIGRRVYATDDNAFSFTQAGASTYVGRVVGVESSTKAIVVCQTIDMLDSLHYSLAAAGTALTATVTRTALASFTIKAGMLRAGSRIRVRAQAIATATNSTDTLLLDIGLGTQVVLGSSATDVANSDIGFFDLDIAVRTIGASGTVVAAGHYTKTLAAVDTAVTKPAILASTTLDTTADVVVGLYGTWSTNNAGNSCRADVFDVDVVL